MRLISYLIIGITLFMSCAYASPPSPPRPAQVTAGEITAGTETGLRSYSPADVKSFVDTHSGSDAFTVKVDAAATAAYLYNAGSGAVRAGTNVTIDDDGDYITINASLAGGAVDTSGTLNADEIAVMHDLDTIKSLTEAEFKTAYNMEAGTDYLAPDGVGTSLTALNGENIQDDTIDDDSLDFSDITLDDFVSAENDYISVASDDTFDFTREDSGAVTITSSDDDADADLTVVAGGTGALTIGGASNTTITATTDGGSITLDGLIAIGTDPADAGTIRLENATALAWEDATEATFTHVDNTGFIINLGLEVDGTLNADGVVALGDGGDNFSVASDGIDIDTSGNVSNAGTIGCGKVTSSAAFESATGLFDVTGAAAITVGSADVTAITLQTDDTGDGTDLVLPAQSVNGSEMLNNTVTATQLSATVTLADGDVFDFSGITHTGSTDEGLALPTWANVTPTSDKAWISWDGTNQILKVYDGGWVSISPSGAPTDATYLTLSVDATLSDERVLTESTQGIDFTDGGAGSTLTVSLDTTEVDATTWSDGANASNVWTFDVSGTDTTMTAGSDIMTFSDDVAAETFIPSAAAAAAGEIGYTANAFSWFANSEDLTMTASGNTWTFGTGTGVTLVDFGAIGLAGGSFDASDGNISNVGSIALDSITADGSAIAIGGGTETIAFDSSDWDISTTGAITGVAFDANGTGNTLTNINAADHADEDWGDFSVSSGSFTLDADVVAAAEMADADHGDVAWFSGVATVEDFTLSANAIVGDDITIGFGAGNDTTMAYDETTDDRLEISTTLSAATGDEEALALIYTTNKATSGNDTGLLIAMTDTASPGTSYVIDLQVDGSSVWNVDETGKVSIPQGFDDPYIFLNVATSGDTDWYITVDDEQGGDDDDSLKFSTTGQNDSTPELEIQTDGDVIAEGTVTGTSLIMEGGTYDTTIDPGTPTETATYQWPLAKPASTGYALTSTTAGVMSWSEITASPAGASGDVQYNNTTLGAEAAFNYNATNNTLSITQAASNPTLQLGDGSYSWGHTPQAGIEGVLEVDGIASFDGGIDVNEDIDIDLDAADEEINIAQAAVAGTEDVPLIAINDDRTGATATEPSEASIWLDSEGVYAIAAVDGAIAAEGGFFPTASDGSALGSATLEFSDIFIADAGVINLGDDQDVTITHVADTGVLLNSTMQIQFQDSGTYINSGADGDLDLVADTNVEITVSDEDLTFADGGTNLITIGTNTGVTEINTTLQFATTGDIMGAVNISSKTAATYTVGTDDAHESYGTLFINGDNDAVDFTLPSAVAGMSACFMQGQGVSGAITVQPNTGDYLVVDGTRGTAATDYSSSGAGGDKICVIAIDATDWIVTSESGTWSE